MASWKSQSRSTNVCLANSKPHDIVICTDGSVARDRSGWGFIVKQGGRTVHEDSGAHRVRTSSLTMEVEAVTHAIQWLTSQRDARITHAILLTDSMNLLQKVESVPTDTQTCPVFGYKDLCGSAVLGTPESVRMNGETNWQAQQISHLVCSLAAQKRAQKLEDVSERGQARTSQH